MPMQRAVEGIVFGILFLLMSVIVSRMVSTFYVIHTEGYMEIKRGKLTKTTRIDLSDIKQIDKMKRGGTLVIVLNDGKEICIVPPKNEEDFIKCIQKYRS